VVGSSVRCVEAPPGPERYRSRDRGSLFSGAVIDAEHVFLAALVVRLAAVGCLGP
jgi:hypothetical protein